jgi:hypothetical protein
VLSFVTSTDEQTNKNRLKKEIVGVEVAQGKGVFDTDSIVCAFFLVLSCFCRVAGLLQASLLTDARRHRGCGGG